jgi:hypothetical protein
MAAKRGICSDPDEFALLTPVEGAEAPFRRAAPTRALLTPGAHVNVHGLIRRTLIRDTLAKPDLRFL